MFLDIIGSPCFTRNLVSPIFGALFFKFCKSRVVAESKSLSRSDVAKDKAVLPISICSALSAASSCLLTPNALLSVGAAPAKD